MKNCFEIFKSLSGEGEIWGIAIRKKEGKPLYEGGHNAFLFVRNSFLYWRADPFLFEYCGKTYLFAELYNRIKGKGVIGVAKVKNGKCGRFKVCLELPDHLSYPCVYEHKGNIYMIPECRRSGKVTVYKCNQFPYQWEEAYTLLNRPGVDTTPILSRESEDLCFFTTINEDGKRSNANLYYIDYEHDEHLVISEDTTARSAGHLINDTSNRLFRPAQDCSVNYGDGLIIKEILELNKDNYQERDYFKVYPNDICISNKKLQIEGIHTYNRTSRYEVIDVSSYVGKSLPYLIKKMVRHFKR